MHLAFNGVEFGGDSMLDGWAAYFDSLSVPPASPLTVEQLQVEESYSHIQSLPADVSDHVSEEEVAAVIKSLPLKKEAGPDQLTNKHLKFGSSLLPVILSTLFNAILLSGHIPAPFKHGFIIPIPKGHSKDMSVPSRASLCYRSLARFLKKLLLLCLSEQQAQLNPLQGVFTAGFSCLHSAFIFQEAVSSMREQKKKVCVAFLDVKKAFDTVWHGGLMVKLFQDNVPLYIINKWYSGSTSSDLWNSSVSRSFRIQQGICQGSILSPLLYPFFLMSF